MQKQGKDKAETNGGFGQSEKLELKMNFRSGIILGDGTCGHNSELLKGTRDSHLSSGANESFYMGVKVTKMMVEYGVKGKMQVR